MLEPEFEANEDTEPGPFPLKIPELLHSAETGDPFNKCIECAVNLLESAAPYGIQKVNRDGETILEFAVCFDCMQSSNSEWSEESRVNVEAHLASTALITLGLDACNICGVTADASECVFFALASGEYLIDFPHVACDVCTESLENLLSSETRRKMGDFVSRNFPGVPAEIDAPVGLMPF